MIRNILSTRILSKIPRKYNINLLHKTYTNFSNLPKPSRFAQQLGLHNQFIKLNKKMQKQQKSTISYYQFIIIITFCIIGSFILSQLIKGEVRRKIRIGLQMIIMSGKSKRTAENYMKSLEKVVQMQKDFYKNKRYNDWISYKIIEMCIQIVDQQHNQKYTQLLLEALQQNLKNTKNVKNNYQLYKNFLQNLFNCTKSIQKTKYSQKLTLNEKQRNILSKIVSHLLQNGDLQIFYLIFYLKSQQMLQINTNDTIICKQKLNQFKLKIAKIQEKLKQIKQANRQLLLQSYQFEYNMQKKWIKFIEKII